MPTITVPSGAKVVINLAPWKDAKNLKKALEREAAAAGNVPMNFMETSALLTLLKIDGSDAVDAALWPCLVRCTRNDVKIVEETFDEAEARKDYYDIIQACVKENLGPLVESLFSKFAGLALKEQAKADESQNSASTTTPSS
jgi:hypothetical protein